MLEVPEAELYSAQIHRGGMCGSIIHTACGAGPGLLCSDTNLSSTLAGLCVSVYVEINVVSVCLYIFKTQDPSVRASVRPGQVRLSD